MSRTGPKASARPTARAGGGCSIGVKYALSVEPRTTPAVSAGACNVPPFPSGTSTDPSGANMKVVLCASGDAASYA